MKKITFYFMLKALFVLKIFTFLSLIFDHVGKWLDEKAKFNLKIYDVTDLTKQIITIHIFPNISRAQSGNET